MRVHHSRPHYDLNAYKQPVGAKLGTVFGLAKIESPQPVAHALIDLAWDADYLSFGQCRPFEVFNIAQTVENWKH